MNIYPQNPFSFRAKPSSEIMEDKKISRKCVKQKAICTNLVLGENIKPHEIVNMQSMVLEGCFTS